MSVHEFPQPFFAADTLNTVVQSPGVAFEAIDPLPEDAPDSMRREQLRGMIHEALTAVNEVTDWSVQRIYEHAFGDGQIIEPFMHEKAYAFAEEAAEVLEAPQTRARYALTGYDTSPTGYTQYDQPAARWECTDVEFGGALKRVRGRLQIIRPAFNKLVVGVLTEGTDSDDYRPFINADQSSAALLDPHVSLMMPSNTMKVSPEQPFAFTALSCEARTYGGAIVPRVVEVGQAFERLHETAAAEGLETIPFVGHRNMVASDLRGGAYAPATGIGMQVQFYVGHSMDVTCKTRLAYDANQGRCVIEAPPETVVSGLNFGVELSLQRGKQWIGIDTRECVLPGDMLEDAHKLRALATQLRDDLLNAQKA